MIVVILLKAGLASLRIVRMTPRQFVISVDCSFPVSLSIGQRQNTNIFTLPNFLRGLLLSLIRIGVVGRV